MRNRTIICLSISIVSLLIFTANAFAYGEPLGETIWTEYTKAADGEEDATNEIYHALYERGDKEDEYQLVKEWNEYEWEAEGRDLEATAVEISNLPEKTDLEDWFGKPATEDGEKMKAYLDEQGENIHAPMKDVLDDAGGDDGGGGGILGAVDGAGEAGGVLDVGLGATLIGGAVFGPLAFVAGVDIGHELAQLFGFTRWEEEEKATEQREILEKEAENEYFIGLYHSGTTFPGFPPLTGWYLVGGCDGSLFCSTEEIATVDGKLNAALDEELHNPEAGLPYRVVEDKSETALKMGLVCEQEELIKCVVEGQKTSEPEVLGVPQTGQLTAGQESLNEKEHLPRHPSDPEIKPPLPTTGPIITKTLVREKVIEKALETPPYRKVHEEIATKTPEVTEELETQKLLEIPPIGKDELYTQYKTRVETAGFTDVQEHILSETSTDPDVGPEEVTTVAPAPGSEQAPGTKVDVDVNPEDAPVPGETHASIAGPVEPGFKLPKLGVLCKGFPFGVPCWLAETVSSWSTSAEAPEWGVNEFEVEHTKIPPIKVKLSKLEPIMEYVRPALVIFATIGLVLLFFNFAKGGGPPSGSNSDLGPAPWNNIPEGD